MSLPVAAMIDTNIKSFLFTFPIPSNDDAIDSVCYIISILSKKILLLKYKKLML
jgi:ribosomal protein S2